MGRVECTRTYLYHSIPHLAPHAFLGADLLRSCSPSITMQRADSHIIPICVDCSPTVARRSLREQRPRQS